MGKITDKHQAFLYSFFYVQQEKKQPNNKLTKQPIEKKQTIMASNSIGNPYKRKVFTILNTQTLVIELVTSKKKLYLKLDDFFVIEDVNFERLTNYNQLINIMRRGLQWKFNTRDEYSNEAIITVEQHEI